MSDYVAQQPPYDLATPLYTFNDAVERVLDIYGVSRMDRNLRNAIRAVKEVYAEINAPKRWNYYNTRLPLATVAPITDGTAEYDHTGHGSGERIVTFSTGTLPDDVAFYVIKLGDTHYEVGSRVDATHLQLTERSNPGADVAATTYLLYKEGYPLPADFRSCGDWIDVANRFNPLDKCSADDQLFLGRVYTTGEPRAYTFRGLPRLAKGLAIVFGPIPNAVRHYETIYQRQPRPLTVLSYATGTASVTSGSRSVTIAGGGAMVAKFAGCVIRFGTSSAAPVPIEGGLDDGEPFGMERIISSVDSSSTLTLDVAASDTFTTVKYSISAPLDIRDGAMMSYFWRACEARLARIEGKEDREERENAVMPALMLAAADDNLSSAPTRVCYPPMSLADIANEVTP